MIYDVILNHMTEDELRNYISRMFDVQQADQELIYAECAVIEDLQHLSNDRAHEKECFIRFNRERDWLADLDKQMHEKYKSFLQEPVCETYSPEPSVLTTSSGSF